MPFILAHRRQVVSDLQSCRTTMTMQTAGEGKKRRPEMEPFIRWELHRVATWWKMYNFTLVIHRAHWHKETLSFLPKSKEWAKNKIDNTKKTKKMLTQISILQRIDQLCQYCFPFWRRKIFNVHFLNCTLHNLITNEFSSLEKLVIPEQCRSLKEIILITTYIFHIIGGEEDYTINIQSDFNLHF